ncbi:MAG: outer membrane beta-barrel protein [Alphaproteobacteria bacterium]
MLNRSASNRWLGSAHGLALPLLAAAVGLAVTAGEARADARAESVSQRIRPEYEPLGLPLDLLFWETGRLFAPDSTRPREGETAFGSFIVFPSVDFSVEFNDNVFREETGENSDIIFRVTPLIRLESDWDNHFLAIEGGLEYGKFVDLSGEDYLDGLAAAEGRIDVTEDIDINGRVEYRASHEGRGDVDDPGAQFDITTYDRWGGQIGARYDNPLLTVEPGYEFFAYDYDDASGPGGTINNDDRDRTEQRAFVRLSHQLQEDLSVFVEPSLNWVSYDSKPDDDGFNRDNNGYAVVVGAEWDPDEVWEIRGGIGYQNQDYDDPAFSSISGITFGGTVLWNVDELTTVEAGFDRYIDQTTLTNSAGKVNDQFAVNVDHELLPNWILSGEGLYRRENFNGISRDDDFYGAGISTDYYLGENVVIGAEYFYERRDSDAVNESYSSNSLILNLLLRM